MSGLDSFGGVNVYVPRSISSGRYLYFAVAAGLLRNWAFNMPRLAFLQRFRGATRYIVSTQISHTLPGYVPTALFGCGLLKKHERLALVL